MTRNEAFEIAKKIGNSVPWYEDNVRLLEALGLIKFDEEKQIKTPALIIHDLFPGMKFNDCDKIINGLIEGGYILARKGMLK